MVSYPFCGGFRNVALIVQKYGGTSAGDVERIQNVARRCIATQRAGNDVVVVVSAMSGETNRCAGMGCRQRGASTSWPSAAVTESTAG